MSKKSQETPAFTDVKLPVISLALDKIKVDEAKNLRRFNPDSKSVEELALDIRDNGMINPVLVKRIPVSELDAAGPQEFELVAGYQRMKALAFLNDNGTNVDSVSASVVDVMEDNPKRSKILNLKENLRRSEISYIDAAYAVKELQEDITAADGTVIQKGMTAGDVAKEFKKSGAWISYVSKMLTLRPEIQKKIHAGEIPFRLAKTLPDMTEEEQDQALEELKSGASGSEVARKAKAKKGKKDKRGRKAKEDTTENKNISSKQAILSLEEMVAELKAEPEEKRNKAEEAAAEYAVGLYKGMIRFLSGSIGVKALHNVVVKGL